MTVSQLLLFNLIEKKIAAAKGKKRKSGSIKR